MARFAFAGPRRWWVAGLGLAAILLGGWFLAGGFADRPRLGTADYVGRQACLECHPAQADAFHGSHHDLAMDLATEETVLARFDGRAIEHHGQTSVVYRDGERFMVRTEGPDGQPGDFEVKYVFGVEPLQQYMVEFDRAESMADDEVSRVQVLRLSWDTQRQQWFHLDPPDVSERLEPDDPLHWTGPAQCWNTTCAECHSTNLQKNYDPERGQYRTTFTEIDVSCEACHGPGSEHVEMARRPGLLRNWSGGYGLASLKTESNQPQVEMCARCHSRRRVLKSGYHAGLDFHDYYTPELIHEQTYHADGQILDEVYVYGSFLQSKMYHQNIRCTDCHDPHTARLKHDGNRVCTSCHQHPAGQYDTPAHHQHQAGSPGARCVECHMPETTYMHVDARRDHSLRIPRPDLSVKFGTPNACSRCHIDPERLPEDRRDQVRQYLDWILLARDGDERIAAELRKVDQAMAAATMTWYGAPEFPPLQTEAWQLARESDPQAIPELARLVADRQQPGIVRASTLQELARFQDPESLAAAWQAVQDRDGLVRASALMRIESHFRQLARAAAALNDPRRRRSLYRESVERIEGLLVDPRPMVRMEAARVLATVPEDIRRELLEPERRRDLETAIDEIIASLMVNNDRALAYVALGNLHEELGDFESARDAYRTGIRVEPSSTGPRTNLAALLEREIELLAQRAQMAQQAGYLGEARQLAGEANELAASYQPEIEQLRSEELELLAKDAARLPDAAVIQYRYGLSLHLHGRSDEAEQALRKAYELAPGVSDYVLALALYYEHHRNWDLAIQYCGELLQLVPDDPGYQNLRVRIEQGRREDVPLADPQPPPADSNPSLNPGPR